MAPYVMQININNQTDNTLKYLGAAFYDKDGDVRTNPSNVDPRSTGSGGALEKKGGTDGLFGLIAYSCPDPSQMLIIYITMPATSGTLNHCYVAMAPASAAIGDDLANDAYNLKLSYQTEGIMNYPFTQSGKSFTMQVIPKVNDPYATNTYSSVQVSLTGGN